MIYRLTSKLEGMVVERLRLDNRFPPLFIVGVPRSGTTAVLLHLFNRFRFSYFPNISRQYYRAPVCATLWGRLAHNYTPTYSNRFGEVEGPMAPSDGWEIFFRWFPRYDLSQPVKTSRLFQLKTLVRFMEILLGAPFINKNNSNPVRIPQLADIFPDALFVHVERDIFETVMSNLEARKRHSVEPGKWWSCAPPTFYNHHFDSELEQVVAQVWDVNRFILRSLENIDPRRWLRLSYREFCRQPDRLLQWVERAYKDLGFPLTDRAGFVNVPQAIRHSAREIPEDLKREMELILKKIEKP
jgi:hypothetical protein